MNRIVLYHNPSCSKSRGALAILRERDVELDVVEYLKTPLSEADLKAIAQLIDEPAAALVRKDSHFKELGLAAENYDSEEAVAKLLAAHPKLMQRPVAVRGDKAVIARPSEKVEELL